MVFFIDIPPDAFQPWILMANVDIKILVDCMIYRGQGSHASARANTHKPMLWREELSVYCAKLSVDWHRCPVMRCIILSSLEIHT